MPTPECKKIGYIDILIALIKLRMRGANIMDSIKLFLALLIFSVDFIIKKGRRDRLFVFSYYIPGNKPIIVRFKGHDNKNMNMILRPKTDDAYGLLFDEYYELINWFYPNITNGDIFIDVGAHVGGYSIRACKDAKTIIAIDPQNDLLEILKRNAELNNCHNIITINKAVGDKEGFIKLAVRRGREGGSTIITQEEANHYNEKNVSMIKVEMDTLDNILSKLNLARIDLMKIDIEGAEALAIKGMKETLNKTRKIMIEVRPQTEWIIKELEQYGFKIIDCVDHGYVKNYFLEKRADKYEYKNVVTIYNSISPATQHIQNKPQKHQ